MKIKINKNKIKKICKNTGIVLCTISLASVIAYKSYDIYIDNKLKEIEISEESTDNIRSYYESKNEEINIIVLNDSQGINLNIGFWKNSYPEYLEDELDANVIDCSSLRYNKTCHIDMMLENNLTVEEIKMLNNAGAYCAIKKVATDINIPTKFLQNNFGNLGKILFGQKINKEDKNINIVDLLKDSYNPIVIYSSGANDLMFLSSANPSSLKKYDKNGNITDKYQYANQKLNDSNTIDIVISNVENNIVNILSINPCCKIYVLSIYVPKSITDDEFINAIKDYNKKLKELCDKYNITYIDETELGKVYSLSSSNFHINEVGHKELASILIEEINDDINDNNKYELEDFIYESEGLTGYYNDLVKEIDKVEYPDNVNDYSIEVYNKQINEKIVDADTCKKLIKK